MLELIRHALEQAELAVAGGRDQLRDERLVEEEQLLRAGLNAHDLRGVGHELVVEDVVVDGEADGTADDADGQREGCDGGDEVVRADDGGDDGAGDDDAADAEAADRERGIDLAEIVDFDDGHGAGAGGHHGAEENHDDADAAFC